MSSSQDGTSIPKIAVWLVEGAHHRCHRLLCRTGHHGRLRGAEGKDPAGRLIMEIRKVYFHLPGLFEFDELYRVSLPLYRTAPLTGFTIGGGEIGSLYGAPADCLWGGGRTGCSRHTAREVLALAQERPGSRPGSPSAIHCCGKST